MFQCCPSGMARALSLPPAPRSCFLFPLQPELRLPFLSLRACCVRKALAIRGLLDRAASSPGHRLGTSAGSPLAKAPFAIGGMGGCCIAKGGLPKAVMCPISTSGQDVSMVLELSIFDETSVGVVGSPGDWLGTLAGSPEAQAPITLIVVGGRCEFRCALQGGTTLPSLPSFGPWASFPEA